MGFKQFAQLILIEQTLFSLPFAYLGVLFAGGGTLSNWLWVTVALVAARTAAMSFNRVIDAEIDGKNPRTSGRLLPQGKVRPQTVWMIAAVASLALIGASYMLNSLCFYLSFPAVFLLLTYSYFKRFTAASHFYLGLVEAAAPIGGYLAVTGEFTLTPLVLGAIIMMWMAGMDIMYAFQDLEFDTREKLSSIPVSLGQKGALAVSAACYALAVGASVFAGMANGMGMPYWFGVAGAALVFIYQQKLARNNDPALITRKILNTNKYVSFTLLAGTAMAVALR